MFNPIKKQTFHWFMVEPGENCIEWKIGLPPLRIGFFTAKVIQSSKNIEMYRVQLEYK